MNEGKPFQLYQYGGVKGKVGPVLNYKHYAVKAYGGVVV
jgi:hypothetical protein